MDSRADTLSGRFGEQWSFLSHPSHHAQTRSLPPSSSYLRSDRSNVSPLPLALHFQHLNASRSSLTRNGQTPSVGGNSSTTIPSQPVVVKIHSADASIQTHSTTHPPKPRKKMSRDNPLPPIHEYSMQGILAAIDEEIEDNVNAISEILGRSRLVLADQHDSHLPPQGEIRASSSSLQAVAEASTSVERLAAASDDVLILREDASLVEGSHTGSAAYGLLERLQAVPRTRHMKSETPEPASRPVSASLRNYSAPAELIQVPRALEPHDRAVLATPSQSSRQLLQGQTREHQTAEQPSRMTNAVVSEIYLSAGANATTVSDPPVVSESGRHYPLYSYDYTEIFESPIPPVPAARISFLRRLQSLIPSGELHTLDAWVHGRSSRVVTAESQLREILDRHRRRSRVPNDPQGEDENSEMYD